jgi:polysaccharide biosynthesis transport protein
LNDSRIDDVHLRDYIRPIALRKWWILALVVGVTTAVYGYYDRKPKQYVAATRIFIDPGNNAAAIISGTGGFTDVRAAQNQAELLRSVGTARRVARRIGLPEEQAPGLLGSVTTTTSGEADFVVITANAPSAQLSADLANAFAQEFIAAQDERLRERLKQGRDEAARQLSRLPATQANAVERAAIAASIRRADLQLNLPSAEATQVDAATPPGAPIAPKPRRNAFFAAALALIAGIGLAFGLERFDRRLKRVEDAQDIYGLPVLAVLPHAETVAPVTDGVAALGDELKESFRQLRTNLQLAALDQPLRRILVTSAVPGEGKSTVVRNLAIAFREFGASVTVVDADLRRPSQSKAFGVSSDLGLTTVLTGEVELHDALLRVPVDVRGLEALARMEAAVAVGDGGASEPERTTAAVVHLLPSGPPPANPPAVLSTERTRRVLDQLSEETDILLIDTPPLLAVTDAVSIIPHVDAVVVVGRLQHSTRDSAGRRVDFLARVPGGRAVGVVVNDLADADAGDYGYGYKY